jgi:hypothetical protein
MTPNLALLSRCLQAALGRAVRWNRVIVTAVALTAAASLVSACSPASPASEPSGQAQPARTGAAVGQSPSQLVTEALDWFFPASAAQYSAGARYQGEIASLTSELMNACMARSGFHVPIVSAATAAAAIWDLSQFPDFAQMRRTGLMVPDPQNTRPAPAVAPPGKEQAFTAAMTACQATVYAPFDRLQSTAAVLADVWINTFTTIQASAQVRQTLSEFTSCVEHAGAPAQYAQNFNRFAVWAGAQIQNAPSDGDSLAANRYWGSVFVRCGQATETLFESLQIPARAAFFREHEQQIAQLAKLVNQTTSAARHELGR